jgi:hypothetical protein
MESGSSCETQVYFCQIALGKVREDSILVLHSFLDFDIVLLRIFSCLFIKYTQWRIWLRHSPASRKVAGSIPDAVVGIFH